MSQSQRFGIGAVLLFLLVRCAYADGPLLDTSCLQGEPRDLGLAEKIREAHAMVLQRLAACGTYYRFSLFFDAAEIVRAIRYRCTDRRQAGDGFETARAGAVVHGGEDIAAPQSSTARVLGRNHGAGASAAVPGMTAARDGMGETRSRASQRDFRVHIYYGRDRGGVRPGADFSASAVTDNAATLFHEALHFMPLNARHDHSDPLLPRFGDCGRNFFRDPVYLLETACFPSSHLAMEFFRFQDSAYVTCPGICEAGLGQAADLILMERQRSVGGVPFVYRTPLRRGDVRWVCRRFEDVLRRRTREESRYFDDLCWVETRYQMWQERLRQMETLGQGMRWLQKLDEARRALRDTGQTLAFQVTPSGVTSVSGSGSASASSSNVRQIGFFSFDPQRLLSLQSQWVVLQSQLEQETLQWDRQCRQRNRDSSICPPEARALGQELGLWWQRFSIYLPGSMEEGSFLFP